MFPNVSQLCFKCKSDVGTLIHVFWSCSRVQAFWREVHFIIKKIIGKEFEMSPSLYLLYFHHNVIFDDDTARLMNILIYLARKCILLMWSTSEIPSVRMWLTEASTFLPLEKLTSDMHNRSDHFHRVWSPLCLYLENVGIGV